MVSVNPITIGAMPGYTGLDEGNADNYYRAGQRKALLSSEVINPFELSLRDSTGYSDDNVPGSEVEVLREVGEFRFVMKVTPTKKRPGYKDVFDELDSYLRARLAEYSAGNKPVGVFTIDGEPYMSAQDVLARLKKAKGKVMSRGVKIEISDSPALPSHVDSVVLPLGMNLSELTEGNAMHYLEACCLSNQYAELISAFEEELLGLTGYGNGHLPERTEHMFRQIGRHIFHVASIPYQSTSWGKVVDGLDKEPGRKNPENGGDLVLVTRGIEVPRLRAYDARQRDCGHLVRLKGLIKRMEGLVGENTETKVRQKPIVHYPLV